jgi:tetratricopeptide (TPR) repeat protein
MTQIARSAFCGVIALLLAYGVSFGVANAAEAPAAAIKLPGCKQEPEKRKLKTVSQKFIKQIAEVDNLIQPPEDPKTKKAAAPDYKKGWSVLKNQLDRCEDCSKAEWAQLYQRAAIIQYNLENIPLAVDYFKKILAQSPDIPVAQEAGFAYQIAQLLASQEKYDEALKMFDKWESLCPGSVSDSYFYSRGQILYLMGNKDDALKLVQKSIDLAKQKGELGAESWHRLKLAIFIDQENFKSAEGVAVTLVENYPNLRTIAQLASLYGMNGKETQQLAILDALYVAGAFDKESQYKNLAYLYLGADAPYLASKVMKKGVDSKLVQRDAKNLEIWAVSLTQSQEIAEALPIMEEAAQKVDNGKIYATLAAIYLDAEKFEDSISAAKKALQKGSLRSQGEVNMYMGSAYLSLKRYDESLKALQEASRDEKYKSHAENLIRYVQNEKKRDEDLRRANLDA